MSVFDVLVNIGRMGRSESWSSQAKLEPPPGPLATRFRDLGGLEDGELVAGPWGDLSPDLHKLLLVFEESRVAAMSRAQGWEAGPGQLGKVMGEVR